MGKELPLNQTSIPTDEAGRCASGPLATEAKQNAMLVLLQALQTILASGGIVFQPDIDIGNLHLLNLVGAKVNPATADKQDTLQAAVATAAKQDTLAAAVATAAKQDSILTALAKLAPARGAIVPQAAASVTDDITTWHESIAIPAGTVAINLNGDAAFYAIVNASATRIVSGTTGGAARPASTLISLACVGCTYLHLAKAAGNVYVEWEAVSGA